ncbi:MULTISPECIES: hypothetical protein [Brevibacillus]|jgi:hypothetical protein|uniref:hypothetical protein n=1 Tax=Brevibacillus TaxID=55080 RepID=UPI001C2216F9|nr:MULTISPECIES: hypothetical protein [Brevibacillus]MBU8714095.1 hypothetical protein [Brevibacillus parabrevis]MED2255654.1 hypothetical protein [Brevibacillus parabrevis]UED68118.1 hypothetical protein HP435_23110 [Brevibacillus sp. HD3.3A]WDV94390.1 hypothetical protein PSE45_22555 [Brevibacillus parabrevis]
MSESHVRHLENELAEIQKRKKKWQMAFANDAISIDDLRLRMQEESTREEAIKSQLFAQPVLEKKSTALTQQEVMEAALNIKDNWYYLELEHKKLIIQTLFSEMVVDTYGEAVGGPGRRVACEIKSFQTN